MINLFSPDTTFMDVLKYVWEWVSGVASVLLPDWLKIVLVILVFFGVYVLGKIFFGATKTFSRRNQIIKYNSSNASSFGSSRSEPPPLPSDNKDADF